jgi:hypothetical protein
MRAVSTVLDVAVFLLLVSAAIGTLVYAPPPVADSHSARDTAALIATTTATVEYEMGDRHRRGHGTIGTLLARGALANLTLHDRPIPPLTESFRGTVRTETRDVLKRPNNTQVVARWRPYRGAPIWGSITVGESPPAGVDVAVAKMMIPSPIESAQKEVPGRTSEYGGVATRVARSVTSALLPETALGAAVGQQTPTTLASVGRYRAFGQALNVSVARTLSRANVPVAHQTVTKALTRQLEANLERRFDSPATAEKALQTGSVALVVRRWKR